MGDRSQRRRKGIDRHEQPREADHRIEDDRADRLREPGSGDDARNDEPNGQDAERADQQGDREAHERNLRTDREVAPSREHHQRQHA